MNFILNKTQSNEIPAQVISTIKQYQNQVQGSIRSSQNQLTTWFILNVLRKNYKKIPRIQLLNRVSSLIVKNISNQKIINTLFLEQYSIFNLIHQCSYLTDLAFILYKHKECKVKNLQYADSILSEAKKKLQILLRNNQMQLLSFYGLTQVQSFLAHKDINPQSIYSFHKYYKQQMETQSILIFQYLYKPIFEKKSFQNCNDCLTPMVMWFLVIKDDTPQKQKILMEIAKKIDLYLCGRKTVDNIYLFGVFNVIFNLLSIKYLKQDPFTYETLAPLLIKMTNMPYYQLINNWMGTKKTQKSLPKRIENIFRNSLNSGCSIFCFVIIETFSNYLLKIGNYQILFHIFDSFIRKQYLSIKLPNGDFVQAYMRILMLYAIGFINRDRLDGQTQLDRLALNLQEVVCRPKFIYDLCFVEIIKFFRIYENRFHYLSNTCKKLVSTLERMYNYQISIAQIHQEVSQRIFKEWSADFDQNQIHSLQRSYRYAGLVNLGNTCYMNSFMQALFMTKKFKTLIIKAQDQGVVSNNNPVFQALVNLFSQLNTKTNQNRTQVNPSLFKKQTPQPFRSSHQQHDSGQFGRMFLDSVTTQMKDTPMATKIDRLFTHQLTNKIICRGCNSQRQMKQSVFDFILNVQNDNNQAITVSELMASFFKGYQLDNNNMVRCDRCNGVRAAHVVRQPIELAEHLIATVSIFKFDKFGSSKIAKPLKFQFSLNFKNILPRIITSNQVYQLYAFILHIGKGVQRGHYQCFARNLEQNPMIWYKFDDSYVTQQEINQVQDFHFGQNQTPYILFYSNSSKTRKSLINK